MRLSVLLLLFGLFAVPTFAEKPPAPDADSRCAVCGMFVAPYTNWVAMLESPDGEYLYFDGPKDLFIYFHQLRSEQPDIPPESLKLFVTEYYTVKLTPATGLFFVTGSDVPGPMGQELVPIAGREMAETFRRDHGGAKIMRFDGKQLLDVTEQR